MRKCPRLIWILILIDHESEVAYIVRLPNIGFIIGAMYFVVDAAMCYVGYQVRIRLGRGLAPSVFSDIVSSSDP